MQIHLNKRHIPSRARSGLRHGFSRLDFCTLVSGGGARNRAVALLHRRACQHDLALAIKQLPNTFPVQNLRRRSSLLPHPFLEVIHPHRVLNPDGR